MDAKHGGPRPGSGRKSIRDEQELARILRRVWKIRDREACFKKQADMAKAGDLKALKFLTAYAYGEPRPLADADDLERVILVQRVKKKKPGEEPDDQ